MAGTRLFDGPGVMDARAVAEAGYRGCLRGDRVVVPGVRNRLGAFAGRHLPRRLVLPLVRRIQAGKEG
jgi:short-subunit dehydrogenase